MNFAGAALLPPLNAPGGVRGTPGLQPSGPPIFIGRYVIIFGTNGGMFLYAAGTTPGLGNPPILWESLGTVDPYGNPITPGVFLAETAAAGNAKGGLLWNTATPGAAEPLLALFPNATVPFTGDSPFVLGRVFNRGAVNELLAMAIGGGGTAGTSPVQLEMFSQSKDGTILGHISFFDWASTNLICDINANGIVAANPAVPNTNETQHNVTLDAGWSTTAGYSNLQYRLMPDNTVRFTGSVSHASITATLAINSGTPLPSAYRPATTKLLAAGNSPLSRLAVELTSGGVLNALANASAPGTIAEVDTAIPLVF